MTINLQKYLGKYVDIKLSGGHQGLGKIVALKSDTLILNDTNLCKGSFYDHNYEKGAEKNQCYEIEPDHIVAIRELRESKTQKGKRSDKN